MRLFTYFMFRWIVTSVAILLVPYLIPGVHVADFGAALVAAALLAVLNGVVKPILVILTLPLTFLTLGLFLLVINALLFQFAGAMVQGITIDSFWSALGASLLVSFTSWFASSIGDSRVVFRMQRGTQRAARGRSRTVDLHQSDDGKWE